MSDNVPPPPGGYGAGPYRAPQAPPPFPPDDPGPPRNTGRWAAGGIGIALLAVRACLLFARMDSSTPDYSSYTPMAIPTYDPLAGMFADASPIMPKLPLGGGHLAVSGDKVVFDDDSGEIKDGDGKTVCAGYCTTSNLVVAGNRAYWISFLDEELRSVSLAGGDTPQKVTELKDPGTKLASDGVSVFVVQDASSAEKQSIVKVEPTTGKQTVLVTVNGAIDDLQTSAGKVFFTSVDDDTKMARHLRSISTSGGPVTKLCDPSLDDTSYVAGAVGGGYYYLAYGTFALPAHIGRVPIGGGAFETIYDAGEELLGPIAADSTGLYVARRLDATWSIAKVVPSAGSAAKAKSETVDVVTDIAPEPQALALLKNDIVYTSFVGVTRVAKAPPKAR